MLSRALWTGVLALLAWIPLGRVQSPLLGTERGDRALFSISALDVATDPPARVGEAHSVRRQLAPARRALPWVIVPTHALDVEETSTARDAGRVAESPSVSGWRGFQRRRLIFPYDATAPPPRQS